MKHMISNFNPSGGRHCITHALKQTFEHAGHPLSEAMIFGLASGLGFTYINLAHSPMISGRSKPFVFEAKLAEQLNIDIKCRQAKDPAAAFAKARKMILNDQPVLIYTDMCYLPYLNLGNNGHFGAHAVVLAGFDDEKKVFYVSDRDNSDHPIPTPKGPVSVDLHEVSYQQMAQARGSKYRPFPAGHKYLTFDFSGYTPPGIQTIEKAIAGTCAEMLEPPAKLMGLNGIVKFSKEIMKWKVFTPSKRQLAGITNYFQISSDGGTGGGIFRKLYGQFLIEADRLLERDKFAQMGAAFITLSEEWDKIAGQLRQLGTDQDTPIIEDISKHLLRIHEKERDLYRLMAVVCTDCQE